MGIKNNPPSKLAQLRTGLGLSQAALAQKIGTPISWVQKLEHGQINPENITLKKALALAAALGCEPEDLV